MIRKTLIKSFCIGLVEGFCRGLRKSHLERLLAGLAVWILTCYYIESANKKAVRELNAARRFDPYDFNLN